MSIPGRERFHAMNQVTLAGHDFLRAHGYSGFLCQAHVWLAGRLDEALLRTTLARLSRRYPVTTARLVRQRFPKARFWQYRPDAACPLDVIHLPADDEAAVLRASEEIFARPMDLAAMDPISFHLVRRPNAGDVVIFQYEHSLLDTNGATELIGELSVLAAEDSAVNGAPRTPSEDPIARFLAQRPRAERRRAARRMIADGLRHAALRTISLSPPDPPAAPAHRSRIALHLFSEDETTAINARVTRVCGMRSISMALLASAFRAIARHTPSGVDARSQFATGVGVSLRGEGDSIFQNLVSQVTIRARPDELADRDALLKKLQSQLRDKLNQRADLGAVQWASWIRPLPLPRPRGVDLILRRQNSFTYGYFGRILADDAQLCGVPIDRAYHLMLSWSPPGLLLTGQLCRKQLLLAIVWEPAAVPDERAQGFLRTLADDLLA